MSQQKYLVTARKYRPQTFDELVAQEHVSETLKNALRLDRLAHAYLFSGPRGVGKTTAARILAKAINCTTPLDERPDGAEPCRTCDSCRAFEAGRSLNIIEIDAASNNKVDDIRDLRETVRVPPQGSRKKVYIVDEVHMLSNAAFNALLKTLEEPPPYVLFIFATTEPHKVLPTILSRCQRFDFRRIAVPEIVERLREISATEDVTADEASLMLLARKGDGALRDALSVFDQALSLCGTDLEYGALTQALGVVDNDLFFEATDHAEAHDAAGMLRLVDRVVRAGYDLHEFLFGLAEHLRNLLVARTMPDTDLIEAAEATRARYAEAAGRFTEHDVLRLLMVAGEATEAIKHTTQPRLRTEMALLKMATLAGAADLRDALRQIDRLEQLARDGKLPATLPTTAAAAAPEPPPEPAPAAPEPETPAPAEPPTRPQPDEPPFRPATPEPERPETPSEPPSVPDTPTEPDIPRPTPSPTPTPSVPRADAVREPAAPSEPAAEPDADEADDETPAAYPSLFGPPALRKKKVAADNQGDGALTAAPAAPDPAEAEAPEAPAPASASEVAELQAAWPQFVRAVKRVRIHVGAMLQGTAVVDLRGRRAVLAVPDDMHHRLLTSQHDLLLEQLQEHATVPLDGLVFEVRAGEAPADDQAADPELDLQAFIQQKREEDPVVRAIFEQFGGEMVW